MKKILLCAIACLLPLWALAQVKKVAILETVDREGNVSYAYKLMLRSNLAKAITSADGYEAYDRTDMDAIMGEQNFQRTGMVSDDQIRRLGEMTGAAYILVAEAAVADDKSMFITAKILNVETAKTEITENVLMGNSPSEIQIGCTELANKLLGLSMRSTNLLGNNSQQGTQQTTTIKKSESNPSQTMSGGIGQLKVFQDGSKGIVFYEDGEGGGLAVSLNQTTLQWESAPSGRKCNDIFELPNEESASRFFVKGKGQEQSRAIIKQIGVAGAAASWCAQYGYGWYLPSAGELHYLLAVANDKKGRSGPISGAIKANGGIPLDARWFWCSNEHDKKEAFNISNGGSIDTEDKLEALTVIAVRAF